MSAPANSSSWGMGSTSPKLVSTREKRDRETKSTCRLDPHTPYSRAEARPLADELQQKFYRLFNPENRGQYDYKPFSRLIYKGPLGVGKNYRPVDPDVISRVLELAAADKFCRRILTQASKVRCHWGGLVYHLWLVATTQTGQPGHNRHQAARWEGIPDHWKPLNLVNLAAYERELLAASPADLIRANPGISSRLEPLDLSLKIASPDQVIQPKHLFVNRSKYQSEAEQAAAAKDQRLKAKERAIWSSERSGDGPQAISELLRGRL